MEEWKVVPGYEKYEVSSLGRLKRGERILKHDINRGGYEYITLSIYGIRHRKRVHTLVATTFIPNPENKPTVDHIDRNKTNNHVSNLRWANRTEQNINKDCPTGDSGHKNIHRNKCGYQVRIKRYNQIVLDKHFKTLPEAIVARDDFLSNNLF
jgi:hypothetical protein